MLVRGNRLGSLVIAGLALTTARPVAAQESRSVPVPAPVSARVPASVLVAPVQGNGGLRAQLGERVIAAVRRGLWSRGYQESSQGLLGQAVVACQTPECVEQALDAAGAAFAIVPAIWFRESGGEELTLTLVQRSGRSLNANAMITDDLSGTATCLVDELLARQAAAGAAAVEGPAAASPRGADAVHPPRGSEPRHAHAWKAGPIVLIGTGAGALIAVGVGAGVKSDSQQLNTTAVAAWSAVGAAAISGGIAWWVVGEKRRRRHRGGSAHALAPAINLRPTGIDLRLGF